jgi:hypothetical protein
MVRPPQLLAHLSRVQRAAHADIRNALPALPHERTVSRWYRELGDQLVIFPTFALAPLGLRHIHVFLPDADPAWLRFPYAVDHAWLTQDFSHRCLYLHCIVPVAHHEAVLEFLHDFAGADQRAIPTGEGLQDLPVLGTLPPAVGEAPVCTALLREFPLVVPVIFEGWNRRTSLPQLWRSVDQRLGSQLREYVPRRRREPTSPVTAAYERLTQEGLFRQHTIRYTAFVPDSVEVLAIVADPSILGALRLHAVSIEEYAGSPVVVRLVGTSSLLEAFLSLPAGAVQLYFVHKRDCPCVRFCYEHLFVPKSGSWVFSRDHLLQHLWGSP